MLAWKPSSAGCCSSRRCCSSSKCCLFVELQYSMLLALTAVWADAARGEQATLGLRQLCAAPHSSNAVAACRIFRHCRTGALSGAHCDDAALLLGGCATGGERVAAGTNNNNTVLCASLTRMYAPDQRLASFSAVVTLGKGQKLGTVLAIARRPTIRAVEIAQLQHAEAVMNFEHR